MLGGFIALETHIGSSSFVAGILKLFPSRRWLSSRYKGWKRWGLSPESPGFEPGIQQWLDRQSCPRKRQRATRLEYSSPLDRKQTSFMKKWGTWNHHWGIDAFWVSQVKNFSLCSTKAGDHHTWISKTSQCHHALEHWSILPHKSLFPVFFLLCTMLNTWIKAL